MSKNNKRELRKKKREERVRKAARRDKMKSIYIWLISIGLVLGVIALFAFTGQGTGDYSLDSISDSDQVKGSENASVVLVEYSDFECPACGSYYPILKQLSEEFYDDLLFVYRHFPLGIFRNSELAAIASEAAGEQGMFWEMHDLIFESYNEWEGRIDARDTFISLAEELGLDLEEFEESLNDRDLLNKVRDDRSSGVRAGVNSTPTFFLNGERIRNPQNYEEFKSIIIEALEQN